MFYVISAVVFGLIGGCTSIYLGAEVFSGLWWAIGAPFFILSPVVGAFLSNIFD